MFEQAKGRCFTTVFRKLSNVLYNEVLVENQLINPIKQIKGKAIWDTGATISLVTDKLAKELGLIPFKYITICTPNGKSVRSVYRVNFHLPNGVVIKDINVVDGIPSGCDILIGMDIIGKGDFSVSNHNGKTVFSFRMPSMSVIDFCKYNYEAPVIAEKKPGRNDICPCGSGKKYKKCCGK